MRLDNQHEFLKHLKQYTFDIWMLIGELLRSTINHLIVDKSRDMFSFTMKKSQKRLSESRIEKNMHLSIRFINRNIPTLSQC